MRGTGNLTNELQVQKRAMESRNPVKKGNPLDEGRNNHDNEERVHTAVRNYHVIKKEEKTKSKIM